LEEKKINKKRSHNSHTKSLHSIGLILVIAKFIQILALIYIISKDNIPLIGEEKKEGSLCDTI
jgi:hypothetical protein